MDDYRRMISTAQWLRSAGVALVVLAWFVCVVGVLGAVGVIVDAVQSDTDTGITVAAFLAIAFSTALITALLLAAGYAAQTFARSAVLRQLAVPGERAGGLPSYSVRAS